MKRSQTLSHNLSLWSGTLTLALSVVFLLLVSTSRAQSNISAERPTKPAAIHLHSRTFTPEPGIDTQLMLQTSGKERVHGIIQFTQLPDPAQQAQIKAADIQLLSYIPDNAWLASFPVSSQMLQSLPLVHWVGQLQASDKIDPTLLKADLTSGSIDVWVTAYADVADSAVRTVFAHHNAIITGMVADTTEYTITLPAGNLRDLAAEDGIAWISADPGIPESLSDGATAVSGADIVQVAPYNLTGAGTQLGIWDSGQVDTHPDFNGRLNVIDTTAAITEHGSNVAGIMAGSGSNSAAQGGSAEQWKGTAPGAEVVSFSWSSPVGKHNSAINLYGVDLSQNSWGFTSCNNHGAYRTYASNYDDITRGYYGDKIPVIFAAGNERNSTANTCATTYGTVLGGPSSAKNVIVVGAIDDNSNIYTKSSWGPADDGRLKPELVAVGVGVKSTCLNGTYCAYNGTSQAAPSVSGAISLALESYAKQCPDSGPRPLPSTFRALLTHTATDLDDATDHFNFGPDFASGYGRLNIPALIDAIPAHYESDILNGDIDTFTLNVPDGQASLRVTLAWDDVPAAYLAASTLINDLDVELIDPARETVYGPWQLDPSAGNEANPAARPSWNISAAPQRDTVNVLEQILVDNPVSGNWTIRVIGSNIPTGPQTYSLINEWLPITSCLGTPVNDTPAALPTMNHVRIALNNGSAQLTWDHDAANVSYEVWSSSSPYFNPGDPGASLIETVTNPSGTSTAITDTASMQQAGSHFYVVRARNADDIVSESSNRVGHYNHITPN